MDKTVAETAATEDNAKPELDVSTITVVEHEPIVAPLCTRDFAERDPPPQQPASLSNEPHLRYVSQLFCPAR